MVNKTRDLARSNLTKHGTSIWLRDWQRLHSIRSALIDLAFDNNSVSASDEHSSEEYISGGVYQWWRCSTDELGLDQMIGKYADYYLRNYEDATLRLLLESLYSEVKSAMGANPYEPRINTLLHRLIEADIPKEKIHMAWTSKP